MEGVLTALMYKAAYECEWSDEPIAMYQDVIGEGSRLCEVHDEATGAVRFVDC